MMGVMQQLPAADFKWQAAAAIRTAPRWERVSCCLPPSVGDRGTSEATLPELSVSTEGDGIGGKVDLKQLMTEAEQNILQINRGRIVALEKLQKLEREKDLLGARVAQLKAENEASMAECDQLRKKAKELEVSRLVSGHQELMKRFNVSRKGYDPPSIWSDLLLRIDAMTLTGILKIEQSACLRKLVWARDAQTADVFVNLADRADAELAAGLLSMTNASRRRGLHVVQICTEMAPIAQSGSLSVYITNLCKALRRKGHLVEVILPKYASMDLSAVDDLQEVPTDLYINFGGKWYKNRIWTGTVFGIAVTLFESFHPGQFFDREEFYDHNDDFERFTYFCKLALEYLLKVGKQADILHLHNWHTAAVAPMFWEQYAHQGLQDTRLVLTCHDFKYQCLRDPERLSIMGLNPGKLDRRDRLQDDFEPCFINMLKGGIVYSNKVTTVSPIYAADLLTEQFGFDLHLALNTHKEKFIGVYNGLDDTLWDPALDSALPEAYSLENLTGKSICKMMLRQELGLPVANDFVPLVGCILFETSDVDLDLIRAASKCAVGEAAQFVFAVHNNSELGIRAIDKQIDANARLLDSGDEALLHRIVAASDILFCPDVLEPTSQSAMIAMRYGAVPVARQVRGVHGIITDVDEKQLNISQATGFSFYDPYASDATRSLHNALNYLKRHPQQWSTLVRNCVSKDLSWDTNFVESYEAAYWSILRV